MITTAINPTTEAKKRINKRNLKGAARMSECRRYAEMCLDALNSIEDVWVMEYNKDDIIGKHWYAWNFRYTGGFNYLSAKAISQIYNLMQMTHGDVFIATYDREESNDEGLLVSVRFSKDITDY